MVSGRFFAIAAGKKALSAQILTAFALELPSGAVFLQSRQGKQFFQRKFLPRLHLNCPLVPFFCNRGWGNRLLGPNPCRVCTRAAFWCRFFAIAAAFCFPWRRSVRSLVQVSARMVQVSAVSGAGQCTDGAGQCGLWRRSVHGWCRSVRSLVQEGGMDGAGRFWGEGPAPLKRLEGRFLAQVDCS